MNSDANTPATAINRPDLKLTLGAINHLTRLKMLKELSGGEARETFELAQVGGCSYANAVKHLRVLQRAGLLERGRGGVHQIPKPFLSTTGQPHLDFGHCLLRLDAVG